jgi:signal peptidase complex subunit 1
MDTITRAIDCVSKGQMDFVGQGRAKKVMYVIIYVFTAIGFVHGYAKERFAYTFRWSLAGYMLANFLCFLSWPIWNMNPLDFQPPIQKAEAPKEETSKAEPKAVKKKK